VKEAASITFHDLESSEEAVVIVRYDTERIALCLSLKTDGDVEVVMDKANTKRLIEALNKAVNE